MSTTAPGVDSLRVTRTVPASPERVFRAWTTPHDLQRWFGRREAFAVSNVEMDVRVGGTYRIEYIGAGAAAAIVGTYREIDPPRRLVFTFGWEEAVIDEMDIGETVVIVELRATDCGTEIVVMHEPLREAATVSFHRFGWTDTFERLEQLLRDEQA